MVCYMMNDDDSKSQQLSVFFPVAASAKKSFCKLDGVDGGWIGSLMLVDVVVG